MAFLADWLARGRLLPDVVLLALPSHAPTTLPRSWMSPLSPEAAVFIITAP